MLSKKTTATRWEHIRISSFKKQRRCVGMTNHDQPWPTRLDYSTGCSFEISKNIRDLSVPYFWMIINLAPLTHFLDFPIMFLGFSQLETSIYRGFSHFFIPSSPPKSMTFGSSAMRRLPRRRRALAHLPDFDLSPENSHALWFKYTSNLKGSNVKAHVQQTLLI